MSLYSRVTKRGLDEGAKGVAISALFAEMTRYQRGTRTEAQVKASLGLSDTEWTEAMQLLGKVATVAKKADLGVDIERLVGLLQYNEDETKQGYGINSWAEVLAEVDAWTLTGAYD